MRHAVLADTGPLYAAADPDDDYHERSRQQLQGLKSQGYQVVVLYPILLESYTLVLRRAGLPLAHRWLTDLANSAAFMTPTSDDFTSGIRIVRHYLDQPLSLFDAVLAAVARRLDTPVWTYDHHFDMLAVPVWR